MTKVTVTYRTQIVLNIHPWESRDPKYLRDKADEKLHYCEDLTELKPLIEVEEPEQSDELTWRP